VVGIEVFESDATFKKLAGKLLTSYALDAMEQHEHSEPPAPGAVRAFIESVCVAARERSATVGIGETVRLSANDLVGAALEVAGSCVHLAAFPRLAFKDAERGVPGVWMSRWSARARRS
jgi:hypothetical protein